MRCVLLRHELRPLRQPRSTVDRVLGRPHIPEVLRIMVAKVASEETSFRPVGTLATALVTALRAEIDKNKNAPRQQSPSGHKR